MSADCLTLVSCTWLITDYSNRPKSIATIHKGGDGSQENGTGANELDESSRSKAEARGYTFFQLYGETSEDAQGTADFN